MSGPVRVAWCLDSMGVGGTELNAVRVAERIDRSRVDPVMVCLSGPGPMSARYAAADVPVRHLVIDSLYGPGTVRRGAELARLLRRERIAVFHAHDLYSNIFGLPWARLAGTPAVMGSRRWWFGPARRSHQLANRLAYRFAHRVVVNAEGLVELVATREGVRRDRVVAVPNFVEEEAFEDWTPRERAVRRRELGLPPDGLVVGIVANLRPEKDHAGLLRALATVARGGAEVHLAVVGDGPERGSLEALATQLELDDRVVFTGHLPNRPNPHQLFDISVLCSTTEGFSNSLLEAMAAARPVVGTRVGGTPDVVEDGTTGVLVPPGNPERLAAALGRLVRASGERARLGAAGRAAARERYGEERVISMWEGLYEAGAGRDGREPAAAGSRHEAAPEAS